MFIGNYGKVVKKCQYCKGVGCKQCNQKGFREKILLLMGDQKLTKGHVVAQGRLKEIKGQVVEEGLPTDSESALKLPVG